MGTPGTGGSSDSVSIQILCEKALSKPLLKTAQTNMLYDVFGVSPSSVYVQLPPSVSV